MKPVNTPYLEELFNMQAASLEVQEAIQHLPPHLPTYNDPLLLTTEQIEDILHNFEDQ